MGCLASTQAYSGMVVQGEGYSNSKSYLAQKSAS